MTPSAAGASTAPPRAAGGGSTTAAHVEYVGFEARIAAREYTLRVRPAPGDETVEFTLVIPQEAFNSGRVRYQDAPEICFVKLQREVLACAGNLPRTRLLVTDADLVDYRTAHTPPQRGPRQAGSQANQAQLASGRRGIPCVAFESQFWTSQSYDRVIDLRRHTFSWRAMTRRLTHNDGLLTRSLNLVRSLSSEGFGRIRYDSTIRGLLDTDVTVRSFFDGATEEVPSFYATRVRRALGGLWEWLPEGCLDHDPNAFLEAQSGWAPLRVGGDESPLSQIAGQGVASLGLEEARRNHQH